MSNVVYLIQNSRLAPSKTTELTLPAIRAVAVSFLSSGRNAWHSTWIRRYSPGDFYRDGRQIRKAVDDRKTPGTVFYMKVLPAFQFDFGTRKFVMTEINTLEPFRWMDLDHARYGVLGDDLDTFLNLVAPPSGLWKRSQPSDDSIIVQEIQDDLIDLAAYTALSKGLDNRNNPSVGSYKRQIFGGSSGEHAWNWAPLNPEVGAHVISLRWYNKALEALMESRERLGGRGACMPSAPN